MFSRFIHIVARVRASALFMAESYSIACMDHILFIHPSVNGHVGCFHFLAVVKGRLYR